MRFVETLMKKFMGVSFDKTKDIIVFRSISTNYLVTRVTSEGVYYKQLQLKHRGENLLTPTGYRDIRIKSVSARKSIIGGHQVTITT